MQHLISAPAFWAIVRDEEAHCFSLNHEPLRSVTRLIESVQVPFDREYWSQRKAKEAGITLEEMLAIWDKRAEDSRIRGKAVHQFIQNHLLDLVPAELADVVRETMMVREDEGEETPTATPEEYGEIAAYLAFWKRYEGRFVPIRLEWIIGDSELGVGGVVDCLMLDTVRDRLTVLDWKTGKFTKVGEFRRPTKLLPPFDHLDDCKQVTYSIQLACYQHIIARNAELGVPLTLPSIVHLSEPGTFQVHSYYDPGINIVKWLLQQKTPDPFDQ